MVGLNINLEKSKHKTRESVIAEKIRTQQKNIWTVTTRHRFVISGLSDITRRNDLSIFLNKITLIENIIDVDNKPTLKVHCINRKFAKMDVSWKRKQTIQNNKITLFYFVYIFYDCATVQDGRYDGTYTFSLEILVLFVYSDRSVGVTPTVRFFADRRHSETVCAEDNDV